MKLHEMLETKNKKEQERKVEGLLQALKMPTIDLVLRYDHLADKVEIAIVGGNLDFKAACHILDLAREGFTQKEIHQILAEKLLENVEEVLDE